MLSDIYVVLVNYNGWKDTLECVKSLRQLVGAIGKIIIVDNCSIDESIVQLQSSFAGDKDIVIIKSPANNGFSAGNNIGIRFALKNDECHYVWLLNNDTVVDPKAAQALKESFMQDSQLVVVGSVLCEYENREQIQSAGGVLNKWLFRYSTVGKGKKISCYTLPIDKTKIDISGASFMISREYLEKNGVLDERYFLYGEEMDIGERIRCEGKNLYTVVDSIVYHKESASIGKKSLPFKDYHVVRSKIIFGRKWYPHRILCILFFDIAPRIIFRILKLDLRNIKGILNGLIDGMKVDIS